MFQYFGLDELALDWQKILNKFSNRNILTSFVELKT